MLSLNATQTALIAAKNKNATWVFFVYDANGVGYSFTLDSMSSAGVAWVTGISWDSGITWVADSGVSSTIMLYEFSGIELRRNMAESGIIARSCEASLASFTGLC